MDKYEYNLKLEEIDKLVDQEDYKEAAELADTIDWKRVRNIRTLCLISEIYEAAGRLEDSRQMLLKAYRKAPVGRNVLYRLVEVTTALKRYDEALEYYTEYVQAAPHDVNRYILKYRIYRGRGSSTEELIGILKEYLDQEYTERWAYELALLYRQAGQTQNCLAVCDDLVLWFHTGRYVKKALELKRHYAPLTPRQQQIYEECVQEEAQREYFSRQEEARPATDNSAVSGADGELIAETIVSETEKEIAGEIAARKAEMDKAAKKSGGGNLQKGEKAADSQQEEKGKPKHTLVLPKLPFGRKEKKHAEERPDGARTLLSVADKETGQSPEKEQSKENRENKNGLAASGDLKELQPLAGGSSTPTGKNFVSTGGSSALTEESSVPAGGSSTPMGGGSAPAEENSAPAGGSSTPMGGGSAPAEENSAPAGGSSMPMGGGSAPAGGNSVPPEENFKPAAEVQTANPASTNMEELDPQKFQEELARSVRRIVSGVARKPELNEDDIPAIVEERLNHVQRPSMPEVKEPATGRLSIDDILLAMGEKGKRIAEEARRAKEAAAAQEAAEKAAAAAREADRRAKDAAWEAVEQAERAARKIGSPVGKAVSEQETVRPLEMVAGTEAETLSGGATVGRKTMGTPEEVARTEAESTIKTAAGTEAASPVGGSAVGQGMERLAVGSAGTEMVSVAVAEAVSPVEAANPAEESAAREAVGQMTGTAQETADQADNVPGAGGTAERTIFTENKDTDGPAPADQTDGGSASDPGINGSEVQRRNVKSIAEASAADLTEEQLEALKYTNNPENFLKKRRSLPTYSSEDFGKTQKIINVREELIEAARREILATETIQIPAEEITRSYRRNNTGEAGQSVESHENGAGAVPESTGEASLVYSGAERKNTEAVGRIGVLPDKQAGADAAESDDGAPGGTYTENDNYRIGGVYAEGGNNESGEAYAEDGDCAPGRTYAEDGDYAPGGTYAEDGDYAPGGTYAEDGDYAPGGTYAEDGNYAPGEARAEDGGASGEDYSENEDGAEELAIPDHLRRLFGGFIKISGLEAQIANAILQAESRGADRTSRAGNILIFGAHGSGKTTLAQEIAKAVAQDKGNQSLKLARIYGADLNRRDIAATIAKIAGGVLIIEEAGDMRDEIADQLTTAMEFRTDGLLVILEDEQNYVHELLMRHPRFTMKFTAQIYLPAYTADELGMFAQRFARSQDCVISEEGLDVIRRRVSEAAEGGKEMAISDVIAMTEKAIQRSNRFLRKLTMGKKRYDEEDYVVLFAKDFK